MFAAAMSNMYKSEVPQYRALTKLIADVNDEALIRSPELKKQLIETGQLEQIGVERHGAIRLGTAEELSTVRGLFAVMGMAPVGYYDLSVAGIPVHSTAFRPTAAESVQRNPFRIFTSLLRLDLIDDLEMRRDAAAILARRNIFTPRCRELLKTFEELGGLDEAQAREFVAEAVQTFRWHGEATVSASVYHKLHSAHPLLADIVCFKGPHINHLTLRSLDIDAAQREMAVRNMNPKANVEGPPHRHCPILLRQTSFKALQEPILFEEANGSRVGGVHAARFGEIEQRGIALTVKGRALYDRLLAEALTLAPVASDGSNAAAYACELGRLFKEFPDDYATLCSQGLAFFRYSPTPKGLNQSDDHLSALPIEGLLRADHLRIEPIVYEDFLPVSAAGIFQSNLGEGRRRNSLAGANQREFEEALGASVVDEFALYTKEETASRTAALEALGLSEGLERRTGPPSGIE
jgi:uncharacterized glyoxalase superfamily metalloenzyme YdcJ